MNTEMNLGEAWRKALQDEISKPMKPVPERIAFLKGLGYLEKSYVKFQLTSDQIFWNESGVSQLMLITMSTANTNSAS